MDAHQPWTSIIAQPFSNNGIAVLCFAAMFFAIEQLGHLLGKATVPSYSSMSPKQRSEFAVRVVAISHCLFSFFTIPGYIFPSWENQLLSSPVSPVGRIFDTLGFFHPPAIPGTSGALHYATGLPDWNQSGMVVGDEQFVADFFRYSPVSQLFFAITAGYFLWDIVISIKEGWGTFFIAHAFASFGVFYFSLHPVLHYFGRFFHGVFEVSTIWLHLRETLALLKLESSPVYAATGNIFAASFVLVRILFGTYTSYILFTSCYRIVELGKAHSEPVVWFFVAADMIVMSLQYFWLLDILKAARNMLAPTKTKKA